MRRIRGQVEAVERTLESDAGCAEILQVLAAARGAMNGLMAEIIEDHVREHIASPERNDAQRAQGADELINVVRTYLR